MAQKIDFTNEFLEKLDDTQIQKAKDFITNFKVDTERIENMFEAKWYSGDTKDIVQIMREIQENLLEEQRGNLQAQAKSTAKGNKLNKGGANQRQPNSSAVGASAVIEVNDNTPIQIFRKIQIEKQLRMARLDKKDEARRNQQSSISAQMQNRQSRGQCRETYNSAVNRIPGIYNEHCQVEIEALDGAVVTEYDQFNLTAPMRTQYLQSQFEVLEQLFKEDLRCEEFAEYGDPVQDCVRLIGRVINMSTEDATLNQDCVGLFNLGDENGSSKYRVKLNLHEVAQYSVYEGEVVVAEGFHDANSKFNVNRLHKLQIRPPQPLHDYAHLQRYNQLQQQKPIQCMVAAGPFTSRGDLLYDGLQELMSRVRQEMPHVLILMGPFVDGMNEDVKSGNICFTNSTGQLEFLDFEDIFSKVMEYIKSEFAQLRVKTKLVIVPSAREIQHINPLPQIPYSQSQFPNGLEPILMGNPQMFRINDINFGILNADVIKDLCASTHNRGVQGGKIEESIKSVLQQRTFYPLYPGNQATPIEWEQYTKMMFPAGVTPDVLITPSQLKLFAKQIDGVICINPGNIVKGEAAGSFANITIDPLLLPSADNGAQISKKALERIRVDIINV